MKIFSIFTFLMMYSNDSFTSASQEFKFLNINDVQIEYIDIGQGDINIVIESGIDTGASYWLPLLPKLKNLKQRIIIYSRAGNGGSSPTPNISLQQSNQRLNVLLREIKANTNVLLVGHSFGALHVREYAATYPNQVRGMVLLDPSHEKCSQKLFELNSLWAKKDDDKLNLLLDSPEWKILQSVYKNKYLIDNGSIESIPTVIVTSSRLGESDWWIGHSAEGKAVWRELHASLVEKNPNSIHIVSSLTGHSIPIENTEIMILAIKNATYLVKSTLTTNKNKITQ